VNRARRGVRTRTTSWLARPARRRLRLRSLLRRCSAARARARQRRRLPGAPSPRGPRSGGGSESDGRSGAAFPREPQKSTVWALSRARLRDLPVCLRRPPGASQLAPPSLDRNRNCTRGAEPSSTPPAYTACALFASQRITDTRVIVCAVARCGPARGSARQHDAHGRCAEPDRAAARGLELAGRDRLEPRPPRGQERAERRAAAERPDDALRVGLAARAPVEPERHGLAGDDGQARELLDDRRAVRARAAPVLEREIELPQRRLACHGERREHEHGREHEKEAHRHTVVRPR